MIPYFIFLIIILIILFKYHKNGNKKYFIAIFIFIFLFAALRGNGSGDYFTYLEYSQEINSINDVFDASFPMELGFRILSYIKNLLHLNDQFIIIFMNAISVGLTYITINKFSKYKELSIIFFMPILLQYDMHATRSAVAASMICLACCYYYESYYWKSINFFVGGFIFHRSVLVIILIPCFDFIRKKMKKTHFIRLCTLILVISLFPVFKIIPYIAEQFEITNVFIIKLYNYMFVSRFAYSLSLFDPRVLLNIFFFILSILLLFKKKKKIYENITLLTYLNIVCLILFKDSTFLALRFSSFFERILIIFLPVVIMEFNFEFTKTSKYKVLRYIESNKYMLTNMIYSVYYCMLVILTCVPYVFFFTI